MHIQKYEFSKEIEKSLKYDSPCIQDAVEARCITPRNTNTTTYLTAHFPSFKISVNFISQENQQIQLCTKTKTTPYCVTNAISTITPKNDADKNKFAVIAVETTIKLTTTYMNSNHLSVKKATRLELLTVKWKKREMIQRNPN